MNSFTSSVFNLFTTNKKNASLTKLNEFDVIKVHIQDLIYKGKFNIFANLKNYLIFPKFENVVLFKENYKNYPNIKIYPDNFIGAFYEAYNLHGDVLISPDDVWITILFFFSQYVNDNSDKLREKFVYHKGKMSLTVVEHARNYEESLLVEKKWDVFFKEIIIQIKENTKNDVVDKLKSEFTTTDNFHEVISTSIIMDSFKSYFNYERVVCGCGINNVNFRGVIEDWFLILKKLKDLNDYDTGDNILTRYIANVSIIITKFIESMDGNIDKLWWNNILQSEERRLSSGHSNTSTILTGWILQFYGIYGSIAFEDLDRSKTDVPITLENRFTNTTKNLLMESYFGSVCKINDYTFAPKLLIKIVELNN